MKKKKPTEPAGKSTLTEPLQASPEQAQSSGATRRTVTPPNLPALYANGFQIALGPLDIRMFLLETIPVSPTEVIDKQLLAVIMTPETLKLLADSLQGFVSGYEQQYGKIREVAVIRQTVKITAPAPSQAPAEQQ